MTGYSVPSRSVSGYSFTAGSVRRKPSAVMRASTARTSRIAKPSAYGPVSSRSWLRRITGVSTSGTRISTRIASGVAGRVRRQVCQVMPRGIRHNRRCASVVARDDGNGPSSVRPTPST